MSVTVSTEVNKENVIQYIIHIPCIEKHKKHEQNNTYAY